MEGKQMKKIKEIKQKFDVEYGLIKILPYTKVSIGDWVFKNGFTDEMYLVPKTLITNYTQTVYTGCPPHNFVPYQYQGTWGASVSPPTMRCTKCLMTA